MTYPSRFKQAGLALAATLLCSLHSARATAQQFVIVDVDYTHGPATTTDSHYPVAAPPGTPTNWRAPVDYAGGEAWVELEVKTKPSDAETRFQICFISKPDYTCTDQSPVYTEPGTVTWHTPFSNFYVGNGGNVDWSQGADNMTLILKDTKNVKPAPENVGEATAALYMPTDLRVVVTLVPKGGVYVPPSKDPAGGAGGAAGAAGTAGSGRGGNAGQAGGGGATGGTSAVSVPNGGVPALGEPVVPAPVGGSGGASASAPASNEADAGCGCAVPRPASPIGSVLGAALALLYLARRTRRRV